MSAAPVQTLAQRLGFGDGVAFGANPDGTAEDAALAAAIEAGLQRVESGIAEQIHTADKLADVTTRYLYDAGGKRIRPVLALLTSQLGDGVTDEVILAAQALELTHLGSLYHDDVMDGADRRRGVPAAHTVFGNSIAILTGDLLFSRASTMMAELGQRAMQLQATTFERLVLGQMHETVGPQPGEDPVEFYIQVLADKTGSLIAASTRAGAIFSNADETYVDALGEYGEKVGIAFQLLDDVIDLSADANETGKVPGTDLRAGVPTMPYLLLRAEGSDSGSRSLADLIDLEVDRIAKGENPAILDEALSQLRDHAATEQTVELARRYTDEAIAALDALPHGPVRDALAQFARSLVERTH